MANPRKERRKKKNTQTAKANPGKEKEKKKSKGDQKLQLWVPPCVFIYENVIEL